MNTILNDVFDVLLLLVLIMGAFNGIILICTLLLDLWQDPN